MANLRFRVPIWGLGITYDHHLNLIGKRVVDILTMRAGWPKISGKSGRPTNHFSSPKTRLNDFLYDIKIWTDYSFILSQSTRLPDRPTGRETPFLLLVCAGIQWSADKMISRHLLCEIISRYRYIDTDMIYRVLYILTHHYLAINSVNQIINLRWKTDNVKNGLSDVIGKTTESVRNYVS